MNSTGRIAASELSAGVPASPEVAMGMRGWTSWIATVGALLYAATPGALVADAAPAPRALARVGGVDDVIADYEAAIPGMMAKARVPGLALVVVDRDHVVWQRGFGTTARHGGARVDADTLFSVQSMSKVFTATAVMQAVQSGRVDLDAPVTTYLPDFTVHSAFESHPERRITVRMLLGCTAGFTHEAPIGNNYEPEVPGFDAHVDSIGDTWLRFPVGSGYAYSNLGFDLAGRLLERVLRHPFPDILRDSLLAPLGMKRSTFDRARVHAATNRAVGNSGGVAPRLDSPMMAAGGLWTSAADLGRFLEFQLGGGSYGGRQVLDRTLLEEMRTVPPPRAGARAGYALGVEHISWWAGQPVDAFDHGGGGNGFQSDLFWVPDLQVGVAVLTNSDQDHQLQSTLAKGLVQALVTNPDTVFHDRMLGLPAGTGVPQPDSRFVAPPNLTTAIEALAMPASAEGQRRWASYPEYYRSGRRGATDITVPASRFYVLGGVAHFDAGEDGTLVRHRLTEFRPGLFLAEDGETLDLRAGSRQWRGVTLRAVTNGPLLWQWWLLAAVGIVAATWLLAAVVVSPVRHLRRRRAGSDLALAGHRLERACCTVLAATGALATVATVVALRAVPALADGGFLGWMALPVTARLAFHLPLLDLVVAVALAALVLVGFLRRWWTLRARFAEATMAVAMVALSVQLLSWHLVGWGF